MLEFLGFGKKKGELGTIEGKLDAMRPAQKEFFATVNAWQHAQEVMNNADTHFIASAIHEMNATESKLNSLVVDQRGNSTMARLMKQFAENTSIAQVAHLSKDGHILYNSRGCERVHVEG